ncbi:hypothetical protein RJT34_23231 [Clitoria ternatea]|uniref:Uncharacterized protein n=1 Tax=Clitoria ternatea TaxID=43366 RepID=A0AAN9FNP1_CLITE
MEIIAWPLNDDYEILIVISIDAVKALETQEQCNNFFSIVVGEKVFGIPTPKTNVSTLVVTSQSLEAWCAPADPA